MNIYVIRHGQTNSNKKGIFYNEIDDDDLNEIGINQAMKLKEKIKKIDIDLIICSPLKRAKHTCEIINQKNIPIIYDSRLKERNCGILSGKELGEYYITDFWNYYTKTNIEGMESIQDLFLRVKDLIDEVKSEYKDKNILFVTHGCVSRGIYFYFNELPDDGMLMKYGSNNCEIKEYFLK